MPNGERPPANSDRDNYFSRAQMYGSVLSGGLSGHVHGTSSYDITTTGEPAGLRHHIWDALKFESGKYMRHLSSFIMSEGDKYQKLELSSQNIHPQKAPNSPENGLDGWSFMMRTPAKDFALLYFENQSILPRLSKFIPRTSYYIQWFNPSNGEWRENITVNTDNSGMLFLPKFPDGQNPSTRDWAVKILKK